MEYMIESESKPMKVIIFFSIFLTLSSLSGKAAHSEVTAFAQVTFPNGIAVDQKNNVYVQSLSLLGGGGVYKFNQNGNLITKNPNLFGEFRFATDSVNNLILAIETKGDLYYIEQETMATYFLGNILSALPPTPSTYNILKKEYTPLIMINPTFGDIALYRIDEDDFSLYVTGQTFAGGIPFVVRIRYQSNSFKDATVVAASIPIPTPIIPPPLDTQTSGIAVNSDGKVLTTFPIDPNPITGVTKFYLATMGTNFPENISFPPTFVSNLYGKQVFSIGMTDSPSDKGFYIVTVANGLGCGFGPAIIHLDSTVHNVTCVMDLSALGLGVPQPDDVSLTPDNSYLYVSIRQKNLVLRVDNNLPPIINAAPIANSGPDQTVNAGNLVILNGNGSYDPDGGPSPLTYTWAQTAGPGVTLAKAKTAAPSFTPLAPGAYIFRLVVNDGASNSAADSVTITVNNSNYVKIQIPNGGEVWNEKSKHTISWLSNGIAYNTKLALYASTDNGYSWKKMAIVKNKGAKIWRIPKNRYISKHALLKVCVKPNETLCDVSDAVFTINKAPTAEAGVKQKVAVGTKVTLNGTASYDTDNGPSTLKFQWSQKHGPLVTLNNANTATPSFTAVSKGLYKFGLIVSDGAAFSKSDKVSVKVVAAP